MSQPGKATDAAIGAMKIHAARAALRKVHAAYCQCLLFAGPTFTEVAEFKRQCNEVFLDILSNSEQ